MSVTPKTVGQLNDEHQEWLDGQPMTVSCALPKCRWKFKGPAAAARAQAQAHRVERHSDLKPRSREQITKEAKVKTPIRTNPRKTEIAAVPTPLPNQGGRAPRWSEERCVTAIREWGERNGRPPTSNDAQGDRTLPTPPVAAKYCGSWASAVEKAGFPRPQRGTRYRRPADLTERDAQEAERLADLADFDSAVEARLERMSERLIETVIATVRAEHEREAKRLAEILRRFAGNVLDLVQSLDPTED